MYIMQFTFYPSLGRSAIFFFFCMLSPRLCIGPWVLVSFFFPSFFWKNVLLQYTLLTRVEKIIHVEQCLKLCQEHLEDNLWVALGMEESNINTVRPQANDNPRYVKFSEIFFLILDIAMNDVCFPFIVLVPWTDKRRGCVCMLLFVSALLDRVTYCGSIWIFIFLLAPSLSLVALFICFAITWPNILKKAVLEHRFLASCI